MALEKVISGGQTGVDLAALDAALALGLPIGGWCPLGRKNEAGLIPARYTLKETATSSYAERTRRNVAMAQATFILVPRFALLAGGTLYTMLCCERSGRPFFTMDWKPFDQVDLLYEWLEGATARPLWEARILNVAGPRESKAPGLQARAQAALSVLFTLLQKGQPDE
jgi:hypothetical protein